MIIADTSILSTFARIQRLDLLLTVAETKVIYLPPAVRNEIKLGLQKGLNFLQPIIDALTTATQFQPVDLAAEEKHLIPALPKALNAGEKEGIAICLNRSGNKFLTNDKRAHNFCIANNILSFDLKRILRQLWKAGHCSKDEVRKLMDDIEKSEPGMVIKGKEEILR
jgi:predicted nucleic acid-binding protein